MEHQKILILLTEANDSKFVIRKWNNNNSISIYPSEIGNYLYYRKSNLCVYNDAYILVTGDITVVAAFAIQSAFKNCATFTRCISKINGTTIGDAKGLDLVMPMDN